jgi:hypothetical protein
MTSLVFRPRVEDGADRAEQLGQVSGLLLEYGADVRTRRGARAPLSDYPGNLRERQAETPRARHESQNAQHVGRVDAIARGGTAGTRNDATRLVEAKRLAADAGALRNVADEQAVHAMRIDLAVWVKVKRAGVSRWSGRRDVL